MDAVTADEPPHVRTVRLALEAMAVGDIERTMSMWAPGFVYYGFDADGSHREIRGRDEFVEMFTGLQELFQEHQYEIVELRGVGAELVVAHIRSHDVARRTGTGQVADYLMVLQVRDGKLRFACDFIDSSIQDFLDDAWSDGPA
ncbi:MAG: nuclear transport factor 2 family protein [Ilumatobacteraceae bacterium]